MTYKKQSNYKTISWTIKNEDVIKLLKPYCGFGGLSPQEYVRSVLWDAGLVRVKATKMASQVNFPDVVLGEAFKLSLYTEDHKMLKDSAQEQGLKVQQLLEQTLLSAV